MSNKLSVMDDLNTFFNKLETSETHWHVVRFFNVRCCMTLLIKIRIKLVTRRNYLAGGWWRWLYARGQIRRKTPSLTPRACLTNYTVLVALVKRRLHLVINLDLFLSVSRMNECSVRPFTNAVTLCLCWLSE